MTNTIITLQPAEGADLKLPYPFHVLADGDVTRQDVWQGEPARVVGFVTDPTSFDLQPWSDYLADPQRAVGRYVVTEDADGSWCTRLTVIASVSVSVSER